MTTGALHVRFGASDIAYKFRVVQIAIGVLLGSIDWGRCPGCEQSYSAEYNGARKCLRCPRGRAMIS